MPFVVYFVIAKREVTETHMMGSLQKSHNPGDGRLTGWTNGCLDFGGEPRQACTWVEQMVWGQWESRSGMMELGEA